jgi:hypothetical protein
LATIFGFFLIRLTSDSHPIANSKTFTRPGIVLKNAPQAPQEKAAFGKMVKERPRPETILRAKASRETWARTYGDSHQDSVASIQKTDDGGIVIAGSSQYCAESWLYAASVLKLSPEGEIEWQYLCPSAAEATSIKRTSDGGYVVAGSTAMPDTEQGDFWLAKLAATGVMEWQKTYGGNQDDRAKSVWQTADGGFLVVATTESFGAGEKDIWILKLSSTGTIEWQRTYGGVTVDTVECAWQTSDGGFITAGSRISPETRLSAMLVLKISAAGDIEWRKTFEDWSDEAHGIIQSGDGGFLMVGERTQYIELLKLSPGGEIEWSYVYSGGNSADGRAGTIKPTADGGAILVGSTYWDSKGDEICVLKLSPSGDIEWQYAYGGYRYDDLGRDIEQLADSSYLVAGLTRSFGAGEADILILRIGAQGDIERFPEIRSPLALSPAEALFTTKEAPLRRQETSVTGITRLTEYHPSSKKSGLVFSPPFLSGHRELNRSLSQAEYVDLLSWEANPNNSDLSIVQYRLYIQDPYYTARLIGEFPVGIETYLVRDVPEYEERTYSLAGVTDKGDEGMRTYVDILRPGRY